MTGVLLLLLGCWGRDDPVFLRDKAQQWFACCMTYQDACCKDCFDMDADGDVDLRDFAAFTNRMSDDGGH